MGWEEAIDSSRACPRTPIPKIGLSTSTVRIKKSVSVGLITVLSVAALSTYLLLVPPPIEERYTDSTYAVIAIDGDANFSNTALLEGWPGDGSPENPYIIEGLEIDLGGAVGHGMSIRNTQVSFTISNCNVTGAYYHHGPDFCREGKAIYLENVTNGELVNNSCNSNSHGIFLRYSYSNTVVNNTCDNNVRYGIYLEESGANTVASNTCDNNRDVAWRGYGIFLGESDSNTVTDNTCDNNTFGIILGVSHHNTVANNFCSNNTDFGISFPGSSCNTITDNTLNGCGFFIDWRQPEVTGNSVNTLPLVFLQDQVGNVVSSPAGQVILVGCSQVTVKDQTLMDCSVGVLLCRTNLTTLVNNTCISNGGEYTHRGEYDRAGLGGIRLQDSHSITVVNNTCNNNIHGIYLGGSHHNTVANNNCSSNEYGIYLEDSHSNIVASNTCNDNGVTGIYLEDSHSNTVTSKTCLNNDSHDIYLFLLDSDSADILEEWRILWFNGG